MERRLSMGEEANYEEQPWIALRTAEVRGCCPGGGGLSGLGWGAALIELVKVVLL